MPSITPVNVTVPSIPVASCSPLNETVAPETGADSLDTTNVTLNTGGGVSSKRAWIVWLEVMFWKV
ncbi:hypothetical protein [Mesotoga sp.]|uniref:hypothetical protein n=1 Tax=Mesotoga sp. TaxID=2053577 RepID=UPI00345ED5D5